MPHTSRTFGPFAFNAAAFRVERDGEVIALEPKALDVLLLLIERAPVVVEKGEIFGVVWKDVAVTDNALTRVIAQLRRALDDDARSPRYIETVATRGYRLIAPVGEWTPPMDRSSSSPAPAPDDSTLRAVWRRPWPRVAAAGLGFIAALVLLRPAAWPGTAGLLGATDGAVRGADLARHATLRPAQFTTGTGLDAGLAFARDASAVAFASDRTGVFEVYVQNLAPGAAPTRLTTSGRQNVQPAWSPDGQFVAYHEGAGGGIWVVPSRGGTARRVVPAGSRPAWSPDGRWIAFQTRDGLDLSLITTPNQRSFIGLLEVRTGNVRILTSPGAPPGSHVAPSWSPDGRSLLFVQTPLPLARSATPWTTTLWRMAADGTGLQRVALGEQFTTDYAATPDGRGAWVRARAVPALWWLPFARSGAADAHPTGLPLVGTPAQPVVSPDGRTLAWTAVSARSGLWAVPLGARGDPAGSASPVALGAGVRATGAAAAPDGRLAYSGTVQGQGAHIWVREPSGADRQVTLDEGDHYTPFWLSPLEVAAFTRHRDTRAFSAIDVTTGTERELFQVDALPAPAGTSLHPVEGLNVEVNPSLTQVLTSRVRDGVANLWSVPLREGRPAGPATQLTAETDGGSFPHWSPDGGWVAYQCEAGDETHVCVVDAGGGHRAQLTHGRGLHFIGGWIGDRTILIAARRDAVWNVVALDRLTGVERALTTFTDARSYVRYPRWDAAGQRVLFERAESTGNIWRVGLPAER